MGERGGGTGFAGLGWFGLVWDLWMEIWNAVRSVFPITRRLVGFVTKDVCAEGGVS